LCHVSIQKVLDFSSFWVFGLGTHSLLATVDRYVLFLIMGVKQSVFPHYYISYRFFKDDFYQIEQIPFDSWFAEILFSAFIKVSKYLKKKFPCVDINQ
jgi:hypothetical protein